MSIKEKIVVLTGAGISAESGIQTFRDADGLWEKYRIEDVATPEAWRKNPSLVLEFYNARRSQLLQVEPNAAHLALVALEQQFQVTIITQNVDDLHERAGSSHVIHLHGELLKARSTQNEILVYEWRQDIRIGDTCTLGSQLRPHIVWFGEAVPKMEEAIAAMPDADIVIIIGTSMQVYPAAGLVHYASKFSNKFYIDPQAHQTFIPGVESIASKAGNAVPQLVKRLLASK